MVPHDPHPRRRAADELGAYGTTAARRRQMTAAGHHDGQDTGGRAPGTTTQFPGPADQLPPPTAPHPSPSPAPGAALYATLAGQGQTGEAA